MGNNFEDWANSYFSPDSEHLDSFIVREKAFADYKSFSGVNKITMQRFTKALKGFEAAEKLGIHTFQNVKFDDLSTFMRYGGSGCRWWNGTDRSDTRVCT